MFGFPDIMSCLTLCVLSSCPSSFYALSFLPPCLKEDRKEWYIPGIIVFSFFLSFLPSFLVSFCQSFLVFSLLSFMFWSFLISFDKPSPSFFLSFPTFLLPLLPSFLPCLSLVLVPFLTFFSSLSSPIFPPLYSFFFYSSCHLPVPFSPLFGFSRFCIWKPTSMSIK